MRRRLLAVLAGASAGVALAALPGAAVPVAGGARSGQDPAGTSESQALELLSRAVHAGRDLRFSATQHDASWRGSWSGSVVTDVRHDEAGSWRVTSAAAGAAVAAVARLDARLLQLLAASYDLAVIAPGTCAGRTTSVVEARRAGVVAGRFWIDVASGLLLRREVLDGTGRPTHDSTVVDLDLHGDLDGDPASLGTGAPGPAPAYEAPASTAAALRSDGWTVPESLPEGFGLFDARLIAPEPGARVLHLSYSDGLSTLSLFAQPGGLGTDAPAGFAVGWRGDRRVWTRQDTAERVVWDGGGDVWTLVSDAPPSAVTAAVAALPREEPPSQGVVSRIGRGLARMGGMLNPFR